jgi:hypothetical protein
MLTRSLNDLSTLNEIRDAICLKYLKNKKRKTVAIVLSFSADNKCIIDMPNMIFAVVYKYIISRKKFKKENIGK